MDKFKVVEKFVSINGEGVRAGQLAVFIRFAGCNLRCSFCDTMWANEENVDYELNSVKELCEYVEETGVKNVTLTGGEPLLQKKVEELIGELTKMGLYVEIETNGSVDLKKYKNINPPPVFTVDYKLPGSGMEDKMNRDNFKNLSHNDTVKFVAGTTALCTRMSGIPIFEADTASFMAATLSAEVISAPAVITLRPVARRSSPAICSAFSCPEW